MCLVEARSPGVVGVWRDCVRWTARAAVVAGSDIATSEAGGVLADSRASGRTAAPDVSLIGMGIVFEGARRELVRCAAPCYGISKIPHRAGF